jgi:hypothetical protein
VFSPYRIAPTAAILVAFAAGDTQGEIRTAVSFTTSGDLFDQGRRELASGLHTRNRAASAAFEALDLNVSNEAALASGLEVVAAGVEANVELDGFVLSLSYRSD